MPALRRLRSPAVLIAFAVIALGLALELASRKIRRFDFLQRIEWITYDWRMRLAAQPNFSGLNSRSSATNFGFVFISDETIDVFSRGEFGTNWQFGLYWPRHIYGRLVQELSAQGAKAIGMDVFFADLRPDHPPIKTTSGTEIASDTYFINAVSKASNVVLGASTDVVPPRDFCQVALALGHISTTRDSDGVLRRVKAFYDHRLWHEHIRKQARLNGWDLARAPIVSNTLVLVSPIATNRLSLTEDGLFNPYDLIEDNPPGGFVRLQPAYEDMRIWHLGIVLAAAELGVDLANADVNLARGAITLRSTNGPARVLPVDSDGRFLIDWTMRFKDPRLTQEAFESIITKGILRHLGSNVPPRFQNKLVIVGSTAVGNELSDRGETPLEEDTFLTSSHWNVAHSLISGQFVRTLPLGVHMLLIALLAAAASVLPCKLSPQRAAITAALLALIYVASASAAFLFARYWVPLIMPLIGLALAYAALVTYQALFEGSEKRRVRDIFSRLVAPSVVQELLKASNLSLVGKRRKVTVLFADIRGFTAMTDDSHARAAKVVEQQHLYGDEAQNIFDEESQQVLATVNLYLSTIAASIKHNGGTLDKYIGDCVMAFWGAPVDHGRHATACVQTAIEAQRAISSLNEERRQENARRERANFERVALGQSPAAVRLLDVLSVGIGICTGTVDAGLMGSQDAQNYTIFGRDVNLASRLEKLADAGRILIGESTFEELEKLSPELAAMCVKLPATAVRGIRDAVKIYEVIWQESRASETAGV